MYLRMYMYSNAHVFRLTLSGVLVVWSCWPCSCCHWQERKRHWNQQHEEGRQGGSC